ncbi:hypothetical protein GZH53_01395 [Flavihumibacter sp. R14]|nr:hypothetical protein [Flavihumibacter soli]
MQQIIHYFLHFVFPVIVAFVFFGPKALRVAGIFLATMLVDADHLLATPIFEACRCSIGFHPLHSYPAIIIYFLCLFHPKTRLIALGLLMHMATDQIDCIWNSTNCL